MLKDLNELEKIGLAFISGLVVGQSIEVAEQERNDNENVKELKVTVRGKAKELKLLQEHYIKMMKKLGVE